jgi:hypothetical protein
LFLDTQPEDLGVAHDEHLVRAPVAELRAAQPDLVGAHGGEWVGAEGQPHRGTGEEADAEVGVGRVKVEVGERAAIAEVEADLGEPETDGDAGDDAAGDAEDPAGARRRWGVSRAHRPTVSAPRGPPTAAACRRWRSKPIALDPRGCSATAPR